MTDKKGYKVLIPTAGIGSRLAGFTKYLNKSLIDIQGKPAISRIIDMFPSSCEFVIPIGYKGDLVKQFLTLVYPNRKFYFCEVEKFEGEGSGLGLSILSAEKFLNVPFVFCSCDTILDGEILYPEKNIAYYSKRENKKQYRTLSFSGDKVICVNEKGNETGNCEPYIGLACINDWHFFWQKMHEGKDEAIKTGESYPLKFMAKNNNLYAKEVEWFDTGNLEDLERTRVHFKNENIANILPKPDEAIWFVDDYVIKYSDNEKFISDRVLRSKELKGFVPEIISSTKNMYSYKMVEGEVLSKIQDVSLFEKLLKYSQNFWQRKDKPDNFYDICKKFYYDKTLERINLYYKTFEQQDAETTVNGKSQPKLQDIIEKVDWQNIFDGLAGRFHGDFHFENILYDKKSDKFTFLDWRQNFSGLIDCGDIYYDFAKLLHGLIICHELIAKNRFNVEILDNIVNYSFERKQILIDCENYFYNYLVENGYDVKKVKILTALIYLNIAALHHYPYCHLLYYLGKTMLLENV